MSLTRTAESNCLRIRVVAGLMSGLGAVLAAILCLSATFLHSGVLGTAALGALASALLGMAVTEGSRAFLLFHSGKWMTIGGRSASRSEKPARFATWVTLHGLFALTYSAGAGFMIWIAISPGR